MAIREDLVASAVQFLQDPSVGSSSVENRVTFLRSKNLTQEEIDAALARSSGAAPSAPPPSAHYASPPSGAPQGYYQPYPQYAWQPPPQAPPRRDWRDWFIMATVVGGVSYGLFSLGKRYVYPLIAPPTPEKLEQDKKSIEEQFDRAFSLVEQLAKDTEDLKAAEQQRQEKLDKALEELEDVLSNLQAGNRRREEDAGRIKDEVQALKDSIPKALNVQKDLTDNRLREINTELGSLKTLVAQRMSANSAPSSSNPLRPVSGNAAPAPKVEDAENASEGAVNGTTDETAAKGASRLSSFRALSNGGSSGKASIPAWQMAMAKQDEGSSTPGASGENGASSSSS